MCGRALALITGTRSPSEAGRFCFVGGLSIVTGTRSASCDAALFLALGTGVSLISTGALLLALVLITGTPSISSLLARPLPLGATTLERDRGCLVGTVGFIGASGGTTGVAVAGVWALAPAVV